MDIYGYLMKPVNNEEALKLRAALSSSKLQEIGSRGDKAMKKATTK